MLKGLVTLTITVILGGMLAIGGWWTLFLRERFRDHHEELVEREVEIERLALEVSSRDERIGLLDEQVVGLELDVAERDRHIGRLDAAISFLKTDHRLARLEVLEQGLSRLTPGQVETRLRFTELGADGAPLGEGREMTIEGRLVYVDTLVIKFGDDFVEQGDALRGTSVCLFRRVFGENQSPSEGVPLESAGTQPLTYAEDRDPEPFHMELWKRVWDYANDPALARRDGVRASHGEAPFIEARPGKSYRLELRASGGLSIRAED